MNSTEVTSMNALAALSDATRSLARDAARFTAAVGWGDQRGISAILWRPGVAVTSEQSLPDADHFQVALPAGVVPARLTGRDPTTNIAVLRFEHAILAPAQAEPEAVGELVLAIGADTETGSARLGMIEALGPAWQSQRGGRIDRLIRIAVALGRHAEGGPVIDAHGRLLGMSTFGPRRGVLTIPSATIARVVDQMQSQGGVARGWLGVGLHQVELPRDLAGVAGVGGGLMVVSFAPDAPASGTLLPGDILLDIDGAPLASPRAVAGALGPDTVGRSVQVKLVRAGAITTVPVVVAARPVEKARA